MSEEKKTGGLFYDSDGNPTVLFVIFSAINTALLGMIVGDLLGFPPAGGIIFFAVMILYSFGFFSQKKNEKA